MSGETFEDMDIGIPIDEAIRWTESHISRINENGIWMIPRSCATYRLKKEKKLAIRITEGADAPTEYVLLKMGWGVVYSDEQRRKTKEAGED